MHCNDCPDQNDCPDFNPGGKCRTVIRNDERLIDDWEDDDSDWTWPKQEPPPTFESLIF